MSPRRVRMSRQKGARKPAGAIYVGRPTKWGNSFVVGVHAPDRGELRARRERVLDEAPRELRGHDLACWCPFDEPCHADVLLEIANPPDSRGR